MKRALLPAAALLAGCAAPGAPPAPVAASAPAAPGAGVVVRYFSGVLLLPADYVFDGTALPAQVRFQGPHGQVRLGATRDARAYLAQAERTAQHRETICGLDVLRHGGEDPPLYLLRAGETYALAWDHDPGVVRRMLEVYCASVRGDG